jgi:DNA helicase-2/ATP-dependent DNA helicase PcrA
LLARLRGLRPGRRVAVLNGKGGNWAEQVVVSARQLVPVPDDLPDEAIASFFVNPATALVMVDIAPRIEMHGVDRIQKFMSRKPGGFDSLEEAYADLADQIFAVETGLSSDPPMNWRLSMLDRLSLVSNSDAHSPGKIAREANIFDTERSYPAMREALRTRRHFQGTLEFFPEEGKYHYDGHRKCNARLSPAETRRQKGRCPECGKPVTVGVMHRVEELADREQGEGPARRQPYRSLIPLAEILGEVLDRGAGTKGVSEEYEKLLARFGPELGILLDADLDEIEKAGPPLLAEALRRMRASEVQVAAGYDGEYGVIKLFKEGERARLLSRSGLFRPPGGSGAAPEEKAEKPVQAETPARKKPRSAEAPLFRGAATPPARPETFSPLNAEQREAIEHGEGPLLIQAGPGAGKTLTLTRRIAHLIRERGVDPRQILAVTFTNQARDEMAERLSALLADPARFSGLTIRTFHSLGLLILREEAAAAGLAPAFTVLDEDEREFLVKQAAGRAPGDLAGKISLAKQNLLQPEAVDAELKAIFAAYQAALAEAAAVDFDDLLALPVRLFRENPQVLLRWRDRFHWILVDEYQDINAAQYQLVKLLAPAGANLCGIGDPDQAIYGFRGADPAYFLRFAEDYPGARQIRLRHNYRSTPVIQLASAQMLGSEIELCVSGERGGQSISVLAAKSDRAEAEFVVHTIERMVGGTGFFSLDSGRVASHEDGRAYSFSDFAALYRQDSISPPLLEALERSGIPYQKIGPEPERDQAGRLLGALKLLAHPGPSPLRRRWGQGISDRELERLQKSCREKSVPELIELLLDSSEVVTDAEVRARLRQKWLPEAAAFGRDGRGFLEQQALRAPVDSFDPRADRVTLLTLHASKGLEFSAVFLVGCEDGVIPHRRSQAHPKEREEERRLFYVGMTRARRRLFLSHAQKRRLRGRLQEQSPSPFLKNIEAELLARAELPHRSSRPQPPPDPQLKLF